MEQFQTTLKELRARNNLTQENLATEVGVVRQTIAYMEKGDYMPSLGLAWRIARRFGLSIEDVFQFNEDNDKQA